MGKGSEEAKEGGDEDAGEKAGEGGGCLSPLLPCFSYQKPTRQCENHVPSHLCSVIPPGIWVGGIFHLQYRRWSSGIPTHHSVLSIFASIDGRGSFRLPPFLFFLNGAGGDVKPTCHCYLFHLPPQ